MKYVVSYISTADGVKESISVMHDDGSTTWFDHLTDNPYKAAYDAWLAEGNTPEPWEATNGPE